MDVVWLQSQRLVRIQQWRPFASVLPSQQHRWASQPRRERLRRGCRQTACHASAAEISLLDLANSKKYDAGKQAASVASEGDGLVLRCQRAVGKGDAVISIPESLWITTATVAESSIASMVKDLAPWLQLALWLILSRAAGSNCRWAGYVQSLPNEPPSPLFWSAEQRQLLAGSQLLQSLEGYEEYFEEQFAVLSAGLFSEHSAKFTADVFSLDAFRWAAVTVRSRSHPPLEGDDLALLPFADLVQHSRAPEGVEARIEGGRLLGGKALRLSAGRPMSEGETVTMDFGPDKLDNQIMLDHGVIDEQRLQGGFLLSLSLSEEDRNFDDKADILDINGFGETWQFTLLADRPPESGLLAFLRLLNSSGGDAFLLEALFRNEVWGFMLQPVSRENEDAVCQTMIAGCRQALEAYPTTIDEDLALLRDEGSAPAGSPTRAAIQIRLGEKEGLDTALRWFEDRSKRLDQLQYYQERRLKGLGLLDDDGKTTWDGFFEDGMA